MSLQFLCQVSISPHKQRPCVDKEPALHKRLQKQPEVCWFSWHATCTTEQQCSFGTSRRGYETARKGNRRAETSSKEAARKSVGLSQNQKPHQLVLRPLRTQRRNRRMRAPRPSRSPRQNPDSYHDRPGTPRKNQVLTPNLTFLMIWVCRTLEQTASETGPKVGDNR